MLPTLASADWLTWLYIVGQIIGAVIAAFTGAKMGTKKNQ